MVARKPVHQGEHAISRKAIAQGMSDCLRCPVCSCAHLSTHCTRDLGCSAHPAFPAPSLSRGRENYLQTSGAMRREIADTHSTVIARLDRATQYSRDAN